MSRFKHGIAWKKQHPHSLALSFQRQNARDLPFPPPDLPSCSLPWDFFELHLQVPKPSSFWVGEVSGEPGRGSEGERGRTEIYFSGSFPEQSPPADWDSSQKVTLTYFSCRQFSPFLASAVTLPLFLVSCTIPCGSPTFVMSFFVNNVFLI